MTQGERKVSTSTWRNRMTCAVSCASFRPSDCAICGDLLQTQIELSFFFSSRVSKTLTIFNLDSGPTTVLRLLLLPSKHWDVEWPLFERSIKTSHYGSKIVPKWNFVPMSGMVPGRRLVILSWVFWQHRNMMFPWTGLSYSSAKIYVHNVHLAALYILKTETYCQISLKLIGQHWLTQDTNPSLLGTSPVCHPFIHHNLFLIRDFVTLDTTSSDFIAECQPSIVDQRQLGLLSLTNTTGLNKWGRNIIYCICTYT